MNTKSKYIIGIIVIIVLIAGAVLATGSASSSHIDVVGSTSVQPVAEKLVEVYKESHPDADITVQGGGSSVGIKNANDGTADIGMSSKDVDQSEGPNLVKHELGQDGIVMAVNPSNSVSDLTTEQLQGIFSGEITNWNEVGGADGEINVITREEGSGTLDAFESIVMGDKELKSDAVVQSSTEAVKQSVAQDPNAIGFVSYAHMSDDVKSLNVNGVAPSDATIADGTYELQRPFLFLTNGEPTGDVKEFIDWVLSDEGSKVLAEEKIVKSAS
ncbi:phosphate-binding protein PstS 1 precursor [Methanobrevibacter woesei]|uniref:Phosphate-binding protein PstS 1 n=1 Tax=Methanobrevibacter woesei TaxID=190976 RepID=A0A2U1S603_9EURY|nr:phosphate ABC transporter substrate-binding protein [Methanobrevibacter woesei]PWB84964.1 phosphate-binding protein PstS 1 precursor [Methanobrevibacter woesei]